MRLSVMPRGSQKISREADSNAGTARLRVYDALYAKQMSSKGSAGVAVIHFTSVLDFRRLAQTFVAGQTDKIASCIGLSQVFSGSSVAFALRFANKNISEGHKRSLQGCVNLSVRATTWA